MYDMSPYDTSNADKDRKSPDTLQHNVHCIEKYTKWLTVRYTQPVEEFLAAVRLGVF